MAEPDDALSLHVVFFDVNRDGQISRAEVQQAMVELGFSRIVAALVAPVLTLALPSDVGSARALRHDDTGAIDAQGEFDQDAFATWFKAADTDGSGTLSRLELLRSSLRITDDATSFTASVGELQLVHLLLADDRGLHRHDLERFLNGDLFRDLIKARQDSAG